MKNLKRLIALLLALNMAFSGALPVFAFELEKVGEEVIFSEAETEKTAEWDTDGDGTLEVLAIGNSFSVDALEYAWQIANDLGIEDIVIGNLYIGGCSLETHAANAKGDLGKYTYYHNESGKWTSTGSYKISAALAERDWDFISMQQASNYSGVESTYNEDLTYLIDYVKERSDAKLLWHMTWAYQQNSTHSAFPTYDKNQMTMYNAIVSAVQNKIVINDDIDFIVPNGTAVQNSRTSLLGDTTTRDGYHLSYDYGRYLAGLAFIKTVTGLDISGVKYAPSGVDAEEKAIAIESVNNAFEKPFEVTKSVYTNEVPEEGYIELKSELYKGAFWHSTFAEGYNVLHYDKSNSNQYFATPRFTKEDLPVGSIIVVESGWQYRPEGWVTDALQTVRDDVTAKSFVKVTEEWWKDYTLRAFNISKVGLPSLADTEEAEVRAAFKIYVPEELHKHIYKSVVTEPTCTEQGYTTHTCACGESYSDSYTETVEHSFEYEICTVCGYSDEYVLLEHNLYKNAYWHPMKEGKYNELHYGYSNSHQFFAAPRFTKEELPVGSVIILAEGWQYRPDGWVTDTLQTGTREENVTERFVKVTEKWWKDYTIRAFNISKVGLPSLADTEEAEVRAAFKIYVPEKPSFEGKTISILGDSISTYTGVSNNTDYNSTIGKNAVYYTEGRLGVYQKDTWWQQAIDTLDMKLLVNNAWSGSCIFSTRSGTVGAYVDRAVQLHNDKTGEEPDIIAVYLGTNDFNNFKTTLGTAAEIDYSKLITKNENGFVYAEPKTACEAYAVILHKAAVRYPDAEFYCFTLLPQRNLSAANQALLEQFNASIEAIAEHFGAAVVDLYNDSGIKADENFAHFIGDNSLHPGPYGMDALTGCVTSALYENSRYSSGKVYGITYNLEDVIINEGTAYAIAEGRKFECGLKYPSGYETEVSVIMSGKDVTAEVYKDGKIAISSVTGDVEISAKAKMPEKEPENYRFEFNGTDLINTTENGFDANALTRIAGSVENGVHSKSRFKLEKEIVLYHNRPWTVEWKSEGSWTNSGSGAVFFSMTESTETDGNLHVYRRHNSDFIAMGTRSGGKYHNYGVKLGANGIDGTIPHVYRLENRINSDGTNMVYLCVDGKEVGALTHYWVGGVDQNKESDWISGKDFVFRYMGATSSHTIDNCSVDYIEIVECEHIYGNGICTACGSAQPGPVITQQPTDAEAKLGERYMVKVKAEGEGLKYQWYFRNAGTSQWYKSSVTDNTYDDVMTKARANREVYCIITDANGNTVTTDIVKLNVAPSEKLEIVTQPSDCEAMMGEFFCVTVEAKGDGLSYRWYYRNAGSDKWYASGVRDNTYDDVMTNARAGREVYCIITDAFGNSVTSDTVKLICIPEKLEIISQPENAEAAFDEMFCVTVEAKGEGLKYQWYFRNAGSAQWYKSSVNDNTYDDVMTNSRAGREVYCVITDKHGNSVTTDIVKLIRVPAKLEIITQPADAVAAFDEMFCAKVEAKGEGLKYQWYYRNAGGLIWHKSGVRDNTYDDIMTKARNGREVYCVITDKYGNTVTTDAVKLIAIPKVELKVLGVSYDGAAMGEHYCVTADAEGEGLTYQWYFRNAGGKIWYKSSVKDNTYDDVMTKARANREVYCVITDVWGNTVTTETVTLICTDVYKGIEMN